MRRSFPRLALALALLGTLVPSPLRADDEPAPESALERKAQLEKDFEAIRARAGELADAYRKTLEMRVQELVKEDMTLRRLNEAGVFTAEGLLVGIPSDPLAALPWLRKALEQVDERAREYAAEFGHVAKDKNQKVALITLRKIAQAQRTFRQEDRDNNGIPDYAEDLKQLADAKLFERGAKNNSVLNGYSFKIMHGDVLTYSAEAVPQRPGETGDLFFFVDQTGVVRQERGKRASASSSPSAE